MNLKATLISLLLLIATATYAQDITGIVKNIRQINELQQQHVGFAGSESDGYKHYTQLKNKATIPQLLKLTTDTNSAVAAYAGWALIDKSYKDLAGVLYGFLTSGKTVATFSGCIKSEDNVSSAFYHRYWNGVDDAKKAKDRTLLSMDSVILYSNNADWLLIDRALANRTYPTSFNQRIEYLAFERTNRDALNYLYTAPGGQNNSKVKAALLNYMLKTNFSNVGTSAYYEVVERLLKPRLRNRFFYCVAIE